MSTFLELAQKLRQEVGASGTGPSTTLNQVGEYKRLVTWVQDAWREIQQEFPSWAWNWLRGTFTLNTVAGTAGYTTTNAGISANFAQWKPETFRIRLTSAGYGSETKLIYVPYQDFRDIYELGPRIQGRPLHVTVKPDLTLALGPIPNDIYTIEGDYVTVPQELTADADIPLMPSQFHMAIVYLAMMYYARYEAAGEIYADAFGKYQTVLRRIAMNQLPELMNPPAMV